MHAIDKDAGPGGVRSRDDGRKVRHGAERIRCPGDRNPLGKRADAIDDGGGIQPTGLEVEGCEHQPRAAVVGRELPRGDVGVVVEPGADDLITRFPIASECSRHCEREGGHVGAEDDPPGVRAEQSADRGARVVDEFGARRGRREVSVPVGAVTRAQELRHGVDRGVDHLRAGRPIEPRPIGTDARKSFTHEVRDYGPARRTRRW